MNHLSQSKVQKPSNFRASLMLWWLRTISRWFLSDSPSMNTLTRKAALGHRGIEYEYRPPWQTDFEKTKRNDRRNYPVNQLRAVSIQMDVKAIQTVGQNVCPPIMPPVTSAAPRFPDHIHFQGEFFRTPQAPKSLHPIAAQLPVARPVPVNLPSMDRPSPGRLG